MKAFPIWKKIFPTLYKNKEIKSKIVSSHYPHNLDTESLSGLLPRCYDKEYNITLVRKGIYS